MTRRSLACALVVVASIVAIPSPAAAGIWDVLEQLSGPGPFDGIPVLTGKVSCWEDGVIRVTTAPAEELDFGDPCLYFEFRRLHVDPKDPYQKVNATISAAGLSFQLHPSIEVGASFGVAVFTTTVADTDYKVTNPVLAPRFVLKPLRLIRKWQNNPRLGFLQMHYRPTVRFGDIDGADFGAPASTFSSGTELLAESGSWVVIDVLELFRGRPGRP